MRTGRKKFVRLSAWLSLVAVVVQCLIVQTHVHGRLAYAQASQTAALVQDHTPSVASAVADQDDGQGAPAGTRDDGTCLLCQSARASVGALTAPTPFVALIRVAILTAPQPPPVIALSAQRSHNWRSRAPPSSLA
jgi:hypothetical protein